MSDGEIYRKYDYLSMCSFGVSSANSKYFIGRVLL